MKMFLKNIFLLILFFDFAFSQGTSKVGTTAAQFLKIGVGAKQIAMAGGVTSLVDDATSLYWNPAGLTKIENPTAIFSYGKMFADISHNFIGVAIPISENNFIGLSATIQSYGEMEVTTENFPQGTGEYFNSNDIAIGATYATQMVDFFSFGITAKYISQNIYNESASAVALDFGTQLKTGYNGIFIGMDYSNFGTTMKLEGRDLRKTFDPNPNNANNTGVLSNLATEPWELPVNFKVGVGWKAIGKNDSWQKNENHNLNFVIEASHPNDMAETISIGGEYILDDLISFRSGYKFNDPNRTFSFGAGVKLNISNKYNIHFDYAFVSLNELNSIQFLTISTDF